MKGSDSTRRAALLAALALAAGGGVPFPDPRAAAADPPPVADPTEDPDLDGLPTARELVLGTDPFDPDTDRDGLLDGWEVGGADFDGNGRIDPYEDLGAQGADPKRPDVFAEIDWVVLLDGDAIPALALDRVLDAVRAALAAGPIAFHADVQAVPAAAILQSTAGAASLLDGTRGGSDLLRAILHAVHADPRHFAPWRRNLFYHVVVTQSRFLSPGGTVSLPAGGEPAFAERFATADDRAAGFADFGAMALLVLRDRLLDPGYTAVTVLHELGHAFGLGHGGAFSPFEWDDRNYKPNYPSVMNYARLLDGFAAFSAGLSPRICEVPALGLGDGCLRDHDDLAKFGRDGFDGIGRNAFRGAEGLCELEESRMLLLRGPDESPLLVLRGRGGIALIDALSGRMAARVPEGAWPAPWTGDRLFAGPFDGAAEIIIEGIPAWRSVRIPIQANDADPNTIEPRILALGSRVPGFARGPLLAGAFTRRDRMQVFLHTTGLADGAIAGRFAVLEILNDRVLPVWEGASVPFAADLADATGLYPGAIVADVDGDGLDDILLRDRLRGRAALLLGGADGLRWVKIAAPATKDPPPGPETGARIFAADVDGDGADELIAVAPGSAGGIATPSLRIALWKLDTGRLSPRVIIDAPLRAALDGDRVVAAAGRFRSEADGEDLIVRAGQTLLLLGERRGRFEVGARADGTIPAAGPAVREWSLDGVDRMIAIARGMSMGHGGRCELLLQDERTQRIVQVRVGRNGFDVEGEIGVDGPRPALWIEGKMLAADVDGDGDEDLLLRQGELNALYCAKGGKYALAWIARFEGDAIGWRLLSPFRRGDSNDDGGIDVGDAIAILYHIFDGRAPAPCEDAMDVDDSGNLTIADPIALLNYIFLNGRRPPAPGPDRPGFDPTDDALGCAARILDAPVAP